MPPRDLARQDRAHRAVDVADRQIEGHGLPAFERRLAEAQERGHVERLGDPMILRLLAVGLHVGRHLGPVEDRGEVEPLGLPVGDRGPRVEFVNTAHHLVDRPEPELRHDLAALLREHEEEVDDVLRLAVELLAKFRILRGDADRAGIQVTLPHHDAAEHHQRRRGDAKLLGAQQRRDHHVFGGADHAVGLDDDPPAEVVHHEHLMGLGEAEFPGEARVHDRGLRTRAGAAVVPRNQHHVGFALRDASRDRAHAHFSHELHAHSRVVIGILQVVNQLGEILDRVDVVVRWRRDQTHARRRITDPGDLTVDLVARQLAPLAGLRPLRHLDLDFLGIDEVLAGHTKPAAGHLLDRGVFAVAVGLELVADRILAPFARVRAAAEAVHGNGEGLVGLLRNRAIRHGAGRKPLDDLLRGLDLLERHRTAGSGIVGRPRELEQAAERQQFRLLLVDQPLVLLKLLPAVDLRRSLERRDHIGREHVGLALPPPGIAAADVEFERLGHVGPRPGMLVPPQHFLGHALQADAADPARSPREKLVDKLLVEPHRLEDLRPTVALLRGDAHLAHHLEQALRRGLDVVFMELLAGMVTGDDPLGLHLVDRGEGEIGIDRAGPIPGEQREVLHLAGFAGFDHDSAAGSRPRADEMMMNAPCGQQRRHHRHLPAAAPVGKDDDRHSGGHGGRRLGTNRVETLPHASRPLRRWKQQRNRLGHEAGLGEPLDPRALGVGDHGRLQP